MVQPAKQGEPTTSSPGPRDLPGHQVLPATRPLLSTRTYPNPSSPNHWPTHHARDAEGAPPHSVHKKPHHQEPQQTPSRLGTKRQLLLQGHCRSLVNKTYFMMNAILPKVFVCLLLHVYELCHIFFVYKVQFVDRPTIPSNSSFNYSVNIFLRFRCVYS
ncbi:hypothetical protein CRENBAI_022197 [Crenichthys baileyi]|uniref:Uncharacterized protein n=1 Tax=Crenichthys baileyi TaxID=28760 RepID=A0AAV9SD24_9TELE